MSALFPLSCACWTRLPVFIIFHYSLPLFLNFLPLALRAPFAQSNQPAVNGWDYPALSVCFLSFFLPFSLLFFILSAEMRGDKGRSLFCHLGPCPLYHRTEMSLTSGRFSWSCFIELTVMSMFVFLESCATRYLLRVWITHSAADRRNYIWRSVCEG